MKHYSFGALLSFVTARFSFPLLKSCIEDRRAPRSVDPPDDGGGGPRSLVRGGGGGGFPEEGGGAGAGEGFLAVWLDEELEAAHAERGPITAATPIEHTVLHACQLFCLSLLMPDS